MDSNIFNLSNNIENILKKSTDFDLICTDILEDLTAKDISIKVEKLTNNYINLRKSHGELLLLENNLKKNINKNIKLQKGGSKNELYDLSTFTSIIENVSTVVNNIDFEFKKIALLFPQHIGDNKQNVLYFKDKNKNSKYSKWVEEIKDTKDNINFDIVELTEDNKKYNLSKLTSEDIDIEVKNLPSLFILKNNNLIEVQLSNIKNIEDLKKILG
jgi:seryl-tRNA synthetase